MALKLSTLNEREREGGVGAGGYCTSVQVFSP